ncbi:hypothetical protein AAVH_27164 [Aphelenchoides avenae]|nr:hypothetical protein AAVH_27164 [Aphelenchus avenae]
MTRTGPSVAELSKRHDELCAEEDEITLQIDKLRERLKAVAAQKREVIEQLRPKGLASDS